MGNAGKIVFEVYIYVSLILLVIYLPRISYFFVPFFKQKKIKNPHKNKIAVIIPARDESAVISHCLDSFVRQTYDRNFFDIHLVVADEADPTREIAALYDGVLVTVITGQTHKGDALDGIMKKILAQDPNKYDAFLLVDADNLAASDLLEEMNNSLASGKQIICGKKLVKNWESKRRDSHSFVSNCTSLTWPQIDELGNRARNILGISITMIGTGMMVRSDVIKENNGWPYRSLTEDYEMTADAIVKSWSSFYYSHAKVYTEEAVDLKTASKRKMRWVKGYTQCQRMYHGKILKKTFSDGFHWRNFDFLYSTYPAYIFFAISIITMGFGLYSLGYSLFVEGFERALALRLFFLPLGLIYGVLFVYTLITLLVDWSYMKMPFYEKLLVLFFNPLYTFGYLKILVAAFTTSNDYYSWEPTDRIPFGIEELNVSAENKITTLVEP